MIPAALPIVDVHKDWLDYTAIIAGIIGALGAMIAIIYAVRAQRDATKARKAVSRERRRQFELEILGRILDDVDENKVLHEVEFNPSRLRLYEHRIKPLSPDVLPYWRKAMHMNWYDELALDLGLKARQMEIGVAHFALAKRMGELATTDDAAMRAELEESQAAVSAIAQEIAVAVRGKLLGELHEAIRQRVDAQD